MKVYKFGGASVRDAAGVRNLAEIVAAESQNGGKLFIVVSAMGKTTNALEGVVDHFMAGCTDDALAAFKAVVDYHDGIIRDLYSDASKSDGEKKQSNKVESLYEQVRDILCNGVPGWILEERKRLVTKSFERCYDAIVSFGELISTTIIAEYLRSVGLPAVWVDMRENMITDNRFKYANVDMDATTKRLKTTTKDGWLFVGQGFIGGTSDRWLLSTNKKADGDERRILWETTTLGREGSDYSAAVVAAALDADCVAIWKDVPGVLSADPKIFSEAEFIPELTYLDAIELAFSGAQIIHPKTIKPLQNRGIPLFVRPFGDREATGSVIRGETARPVDVPILILKRDQILVSIRPHDYSFVLEEKLGEIFEVFGRFNVKANLVQTSAVNMSVSIDRTRHLDELTEALRERGFFVKYNADMELLTIRGFTPASVEKYASTDDVYLSQHTRRTLRLVRRAKQ